MVSSSWTLHPLLLVTWNTTPHTQQKGQKPIKKPATMSYLKKCSIGSHAVITQREVPDADLEQTAELTNHEPPSIRWYVGFCDCQIEVSEHLHNLQQDAMPVATVHLDNRTATMTKLRTFEEGPILELLGHQRTKTQRAAQEHTRQLRRKKERTLRPPNRP